MRKPSKPNGEWSRVDWTTEGLAKPGDVWVCVTPRFMYFFSPELKRLRRIGRNNVDREEAAVCAERPSPDGNTLAAAIRAKTWWPEEA